MKKLKKIARPEVRFVQMAYLEKNYGDQVRCIMQPAEGQRPHIAENEAGRPHVQTDAPPTTQALIQVVKYAGRIKRPECVIDGYHRLLHWLENGCPFDEIILIVHTIRAESLDDAVEQTDQLAQTIDSRKAAKKNAGRWCAAVRDAGLTNAKSNAYRVGTRASSYLKRVIGDAGFSISTLMENVRASMSAHRHMDELYYACEQVLPAKRQAAYFHTGIATAIFRHLDRLPDAKQGRFVDEAMQVFTKLSLSRPEILKGMKLSAAADALYVLLLDLGTEHRNAALRAGRNQEQFYNAVEAEMRPVLEKITKSPARRIASVR